MRHANFDIGAAAAEDVLASLREKSNDDLSCYTDCVRAAFTEFQPVFTRERYADFFLACAVEVPGWVGGSVLANGKKESDGAEGLLRLWKSVDFDEQIEERILFHVYDEARHSRLFAKLTRLAFPDLLTEDQLSGFSASLVKIRKEDLVKGSERVTEAQLLDHLIQMNMGEIRTRIHIKLLAPVIFALTPAKHKRDVYSILSGLVSDEEVHVSYTAKYINVFCRQGSMELARSLYARRLRDFDYFTRMETEGALAAYGRGRYPDLMNM